MGIHAHCVAIEEDPDIRSLLSLGAFTGRLQSTTESTGAAGVSAVAEVKDLELVTVDVALHDLQGNDVPHALRGESPGRPSW